MMSLIIRFWCFSCCLFVLVACDSGSEFRDLEARLQEIKSKPGGRVIPPPEFKPVPTFAYGAHQLRSPFKRPRKEQEIVVRLGVKVEPDLSRIKEYLESFTIESLVVVGTIARIGEPVQVLIKDSSGVVTPVLEGNYLGRNHGRIVQVNDTGVALNEIVPDGRDGWVERPRILEMKE